MSDPKRRAKVRLTGEYLRTLLDLPSNVINAVWDADVETLTVICEGKAPYATAEGQCIPDLTFLVEADLKED